MIDKGRITKTTGYYAAFIALGLAGASLGPTLPELAKQTSSHLGQISLLFLARSLGYVCGSFLGGRLYDRVPGHPIIAASLGIIALSLMCIPMLPLLWLLIALLFFMGIVQGILDIGVNTLLIWVHRHEVGPFMNGLHFCFGAGAFLSPIIVAKMVMISGGITWAYWMLALCVLPVAVSFLRLPGPIPQASTRIENKNSETLRSGLVGFIVLFFFLYVGAEIGFGGWIFTYASTLKLADETMAAYLTSAFWGTYTAGRLLAIPIAARLRPITILVSNLAGCLISVGIILLWSDSATALWIGAGGLGLSMASIFPTMLSFSERRMTITSRITGWFFIGGSLGGMGLPWLLGQFIQSIGPQAMMVAIMVDLILAALVFTGLFFYLQHRNISELEVRASE